MRKKERGRERRGKIRGKGPNAALQLSSYLTAFGHNCTTIIISITNLNFHDLTVAALAGLGPVC